MAPPGTLYLGAIRRLDGGGSPAPLYLPAHHLVTHGVVVGMTGSGKTGLVTVLAEEALRSGVPVLVLDVKGDLPNLLLRFPSFSSEPLLPWAEACARPGDGRPATELAADLAASRAAALSLVLRLVGRNPDGVRLLQPRWAMSLLRGPMTRDELRRARTAQDASSLRLDMPPKRAGGST